MVKRLAFWVCLSINHILMAQSFEQSFRQSDQAIKNEQFVEALQILLQLEAQPQTFWAEPSKLAALEQRLAFCYDYFEYRELAIKHYQRAILHHSQAGDSLEMAFSMAYLADILEDVNQYDEAFVMLERAKKIFTQSQSNKGMILYYNNLGSAYENFKSYDTCSVLLNKAIELCKQTNDSLFLCITLNNLGDVRRKQGQHSQAIELYQESLRLSRSLRNYEEERGNLKDISESYAALEDFRMAYQSHRDFYNLHKSLKIEKKIEQIVQIHLENTLQKAALEKQTLWLRLLGIVLVLVLVLIAAVSSFFVIRYKSKRDRELAKINQEMLQLEIETIKYREERTRSDLKSKEETLREYSRMLAKNSETLASLQNRLKEALENKKENQRYEEISKLSRLSILTQDDWNDFKNRFEEVYTGFFAKLRENYSDLSQGDIRLLALLKLRLSREEIASMTGISSDSVKKARSRLKKRLNLAENDKIEDWLEAL
jgi:tetratricopeptide (TPR) repeat protein